MLLLYRMQRGMSHTRSCTLLCDVQGLLRGVDFPLRIAYAACMPETVRIVIAELLMARARRWVPKQAR